MNGILVHILRSGSLALRASVTLTPASAGFCRYVHQDAVFVLWVLFWWLGGRATPDPIPNSEVKSPSADGSRSGESRPPPE